MLDGQHDRPSQYGQELDSFGLVWQCFETVHDSVSFLREQSLDHLNWILVIEKEVLIAEARSAECIS